MRYDSYAIGIMKKQWQKKKFHSIVALLSLFC